MRKGESRPDLYKARIGKCEVCSGEFRAVKDSYRRKQKYCSKTCWSNRNPPKKENCLHCASEFESYRRSKVYCDSKCRDAHYRIRLKGENGPRWEGGKTSANKILRSSAAFREWRKQVFTRDNYSCVNCSAKSGVGKRVELHPDHIKPLSTHPELVFELSNGRTLCADCHRATDTWGWKARKYTGKKAELINGNA